MQTGRSVIWRRLDVEGMDCCRFSPEPDGWLLQGTALIADANGIGCLSYHLRCGNDWASRSARVWGWVGSRDVSLDIRSGAGGIWTVNGAPVDGVAGLVDIDLGFTPASNTNALCRLKPPIGGEVETTAVWLDATDWTVQPLTQVYRRESRTAFAYTSPMHGYRATLEVDDFGIVTNYPGLWEARVAERNPNAG